MHLDVWGDSVVGLVRERNEDAYAICADPRAFVVADGLGAHPQGDRASQMSVRTVCRVLSEAAHHDRAPAYADSWERHLVDAVAAAHAELRAASRPLLEQDPYLAMGSTVVALLIPPHGQLAYWSHVGDSRLYRWRSPDLALLTADHTRFGDAYRYAMSVDVGLPHTNQLGQALGTQPELDAPVGSAPVQDGDTFLLCSDGISGMLSPATIAAYLGTSIPVASIGAALRNAALDAGGHDNATLVVVRAVAE